MAQTAALSGKRFRASCIASQADMTHRETQWWGIAGYDVCSRPSFLNDMPKYAEYLKDLRKEVEKLGNYMDAKYPLELEAEAENRRR